MKAHGTWPTWIVLVIAFAFSSLGAAQTQDEESEEATQWFTADELNEGLGDVPDEINRMSPREAIRSFLELTEEEDYKGAAHLLNLSELSPEEQQERGHVLARQLAEVFRRGEWLSASNLSGRQDAVIEDTTGENPLAGDPRRDIELASLQADGEAYDIRLGRYRVEDEDPIWLIMPGSVASIPLLYDEYGPSMVEEYIPDRFKTTFGFLMVWEWIAVPAFLLLIVLMGWGIYTFVGLMARWLPSGAISIFAARIKGPMSLIAMSLVTQMLLEYVVSFSAVAMT
ncbi:MAG: mechanosensitive ion channel family protein, partial [Halomonas sp.]